MRWTDRPLVADPDVRILRQEVLSDDWALLKKITFDIRRRDGSWHTEVRQTYDRGDGAAILPFDPERGTVLLVRQFRMPAYVAGHSGWLIEACAGILDEDDAEACIRREAEEELGYRLRDVTRIFDAFMSPGSVTERLAFFTARYSPADRISAGGGEADEGEDIEVLEMPIAEALAGVAAGRILDGKAIMLLQHARLAGLAG